MHSLEMFISCAHHVTSGDVTILWQKNRVWKQWKDFRTKCEKQQHQKNAETHNESFQVDV